MSRVAILLLMALLMPGHHEMTERTARSPLDSNGTLLLVSGTAYWVYVGRVVLLQAPCAHVDFQVTTAGAGTQVAEVALASSTGPPNQAALTLTKIAASGSLTSLTATGLARNSVSLSATVTTGTYLWAGIRTAMATTQPTLQALNFDMAEGFVLTTAASGALTGAGPWTGSIVPAATTVPAPDLRVTLD